MENNNKINDLPEGTLIEDKILNEIDILESFNDNTIIIRNITGKETQIYNLDKFNINDL